MFFIMCSNSICIGMHGSILEWVLLSLTVLTTQYWPPIPGVNFSGQMYKPAPSKYSFFTSNAHFLFTEAAETVVLHIIMDDLHMTR